MSKSRPQLESLCAKPPKDLEKYFDTFDIKAHAKGPAGSLPLSKAVALSKEFRGFHPVAIGLELIVLDDANTSNHHAYVTRGPLKGGILYLSHDDDTRLVFAKLAAYTNAVTEATETDSALEDSHPTAAILGGNQSKLSQEVLRLLDDGDEAILLVYIAAMDLRDTALLGTLALHDNFYIVEAVGNAVAASPRTDLLPVAAPVAKHKHPQAKAAGKRAVAAIKALK